MSHFSASIRSAEGERHEGDGEQNKGGGGEDCGKCGGDGNVLQLCYLSFFYPPEHRQKHRAAPLSAHSRDGVGSNTC